METHQVKPSVNSTRLPLDHLGPGPGAGSYIFKPEKRVCFHPYGKKPWTCQEALSDNDLAAPQKSIQG